VAVPIKLYCSKYCCREL